MSIVDSIDRRSAFGASELRKTYAPLDIEAFRNADEARLKGRRRMRIANETGAKVSNQHSGTVSIDTKPKRNRAGFGYFRSRIRHRM